MWTEEKMFVCLGSLSLVCFLGPCFPIFRAVNDFVSCGELLGGGVLSGSMTKDVRMLHVFGLFSAG